MRIRLKHLRGSLVGALTLSSLAPLAEPLPGGFEHSGWYQFEVVVMVDTREETLESETWPLLPTVGYPARWRWLQTPPRSVHSKQNIPMQRSPAVPRAT